MISQPQRLSMNTEFRVGPGNAPWRRVTSARQVPAHPDNFAELETRRGRLSSRGGLRCVEPDRHGITLKTCADIETCIRLRAPWSVARCRDVIRR